MGLLARLHGDHIIIFVLLHNIAALLFRWSRQACPLLDACCRLVHQSASLQCPSLALSQFVRSPQSTVWRCRVLCTTCFLRCCLRTSAAHAQAASARTRRYEAVLLGVGVNVSRESGVLFAFIYFYNSPFCFPCLCLLHLPEPEPEPAATHWKTRCRRVGECTPTTGSPSSLAAPVRRCWAHLQHAKEHSENYVVKKKRESYSFLFAIICFLSLLYFHVCSLRSVVID